MLGQPIPIEPRGAEMAIVTRKVSDISGAEAPEGDFATVIVRTHPKVTDPKRLDALPAELTELKEVGDLVILEVTQPDGATGQLYVRYSDFSKLVPDDVVAKAPGTRGRVPGTRVSGNGSLSLVSAPSTAPGGRGKAPSWPSATSGWDGVF